MTKSIKLSRVETRIILNLILSESNLLYQPKKSREAKVDQINLNVVRYAGRTKVKGEAGYFRYLRTLIEKLRKFDESFYKK